MTISEDTYVIQTVYHDLIYLKNEWDQSIDDQSLRRNSNVLRMLLVDDEYGRTWRLIGFKKQPQVSAIDLSEQLGGISYPRITFAQAGGATFKGMTVAGALQTNDVMSEREIKRRYERLKDGPVLRTFSLSQFMKSPCIITNGLEVTRRDVVKYVANKLGGTHLDTTRDTRKEDERKFKALDTLSSVRLADKHAVFFELLSIGQAVAHSGDAQTFCNRVQEMLARQ